MNKILIYSTSIVVQNQTFSEIICDNLRILYKYSVTYVYCILSSREIVNCQFIFNCKAYGFSESFIFLLSRLNYNLFFTEQVKMYIENIFKNNLFNFYPNFTFHNNSIKVNYRGKYYSYSPKINV